MISTFSWFLSWLRELSSFHAVPFFSLKCPPALPLNPRLFFYLSAVAEVTQLLIDLASCVLFLKLPSFVRRLCSRSAACPRLVSLPPGALQPFWLSEVLLLRLKALERDHLFVALLQVRFEHHKTASLYLTWREDFPRTQEEYFQTEGMPLKRRQG